MYRFCVNPLILFAIFVLSCQSGLEKVTEVLPSTHEKLVYHIHKKTGLKNGTFIRFIGDRKMEEAIYVNDTLHGKRVLYDSLENVIIEEQYVKGQFDGWYKRYYPDGQVLLEVMYDQGFMHGKLRKYYENGQVMEEVEMKENEENGPFIEYYENGNLKAEGQYLDGDYEHGELKLYRESDGALERIMDCNRGICATRWHIDSLNNE